MKNIQGLKQVCLYDPATGDRVLLKSISPDSGVTKEPIPTEVVDGAVHGGHTHAAEIVFFDLPEGGRDLMEGWENDDTEVNMVGVTGTGALLWYHPTTITGFVDSLATNARDGVSPFRFEMTAVGYDLDIYYGMNIFRAAIKRNEDGRTQRSGGFYVPKRRESGLLQFNIINTTSNEESGFIGFVFPIPNIDLVFGQLFLGVPDVTAIQSLDFAGSVINDVSLIDTPVTLNTGAAAYSIMMDFSGGAVEEVFIRVAGDEYTEQ